MTCMSFLSLFELCCIKQREEGAVVNPEAKSENPAPDLKAEAERPTSVEKTEGENSVPAPKAVSILLCF